MFAKIKKLFYTILHPEFARLGGSVDGEPDE